MLGFTTGFESINYKQKKIKLICISACEEEAFLMNNNCGIIKLKNCFCLFIGIRERQIYFSLLLPCYWLQGFAMFLYQF